jgi:hypothetical protein
MADSSVAVTAGAGTLIDTVTTPAGDHRQVVIPADRGGFNGRYTTLRTIGRAGTTGQNLASIWNAAGSTVNVNVKFVGYDIAVTVVKAITVLPPVLRLHKLTTIPTGGTAGYKVAVNSALTSNASVTTLQDAATDTTLSATALGFTQTTAASGLTQEWAPRLISGAGYEMGDRLEFLGNGDVTLRPGEGLGVRLDYTLATQNPATDIHIVTMLWEEYAP